MENVLSAIIVVFIILFAVLTLSQTFIATQETLGATRLELENRLVERLNTQLSPIEGVVEVGGSGVELTLHNSGSTRLTEFEDWDVIVHYYETETTFRVAWLSYVDAAPNNNEWTLEGIYVNADQAEVYEPRILNPGEDLTLYLALTPIIAPGGMVYATVSTHNGISTSLTFTRNALPILITNEPLVMGYQSSKTITQALLETTDIDNEAEALIYTVTVPPAQGTLNPGNTFTQADINTGQIIYTHTGTESDTFSFVVSDGEYEIGEYVFEVQVNQPPMLAANAPLIIATGESRVINQSLLAVTDADNLASELVYNLVTAPTQGTLSRGSTFTQEDIDNNLLLYTYSGVGDDSFQFTVSDGFTTIGAYTFIISSN